VYYMKYTENLYEKSANSFEPQCTGKSAVQTWNRSRRINRGF